MAEEVASTTLSAARQAMEITTELLKIIAPYIPKMFKGAIDVTRWFEDKNTMHQNGSVKKAALVAIAAKANSAVISQDNILSSDVDSIVAKAKANRVPVSVMGDGEKKSIAFLDRDKAEINQIIQEVMTERLREAPQNAKAFPISENNVKSLKAEFERNGVECQFVKGADGKVRCVYNAADTEKVDLIKADYKAMRHEIADKLRVTADKAKSGIEIADTKTGKSITIDRPIGELRQYQIVNVCMKELGYTRAEAELAANKLCDDLKLDHGKYLLNTQQRDLLNSLKTNIRFESDSILLRDTTFSAVNMQGADNTHVFITTRAGKSVALTPSIMTEQEMKNICTSQLSMTERQATETVSKAIKVDTHIQSKIKERVTDKVTGMSHTAEIERTAHNSFSVKVGTKQKTYDINDPDLANKISKDFGISVDKANRIVNKAKLQSPMQNKMNKLFNAAKEKVGMGTKTQNIIPQNKRKTL